MEVVGAFLVELSEDVVVSCVFDLLRLRGGSQVRALQDAALNLLLADQETVQLFFISLVNFGLGLD